MTIDPADSPSEGAVNVHITADPTLSYAALQNNIPIVRELTLTNTTDRVLSEVHAVISLDPPISDPFRIRFECLGPGETRRVAAIDIKAHHSHLAGLTESERGLIKVDISAGEEVLASVSKNLDVLAYDQWAGVRALPELLAAFCTPNDPVIDHLLGKASELLKRLPDQVSMNGYQSGHRESVLHQISAIYNVVKAEGLHYSSPPASFGSDGQKIRNPERIMSGRIATCLDLALLFASCLEQAGLHPLVLLSRNHAWVGCWLTDQTLPDPTTDDLQAIRKRVQTGEIVVFETTVVASNNPVSLRSAFDLGRQHLEEDSEFVFAVDITSARRRKILPLPSRSEAQLPRPLASSVEATAIEEMPPLPPLDPVNLGKIDLTVNADTPAGRLARWKSKLLDLTLRNRLLNFKPTKSNFELLVPEPGPLEDALADGVVFRIHPLPTLMEGDDPRVAAVHVARTGLRPLPELAKESMERKELLAMVDAKDLDGRLFEVYNNAKISLEEGGANTLFLAIGFLRWTDVDKGAASYLAPLLLLPVTLKRQSVRSGYRLEGHDDDTIVNPTLLQLLREQYQLNLVGLDPLPKDGNGIDVGRVWQIFRLAIAEIKGWEIVEKVYIGTFSFTKYLMWKDLQDRTDALRQSRVVAHLIDHPGESFAPDERERSERSLDDEYRPQDIHAPMLADSSQLRALCTAAEGSDFVLEGPPGTGKSQTITNLISHFLAQGKTVLFVSEKMAALSVVHRRLAANGLGPFCLELHSAKAKKSEVLQQLGAALNFPGGHPVADWEREADRLAALRQDLNALVNVLHEEHPNGLTVYDATGIAILHSEWDPAHFSWTDPFTHDRVALDMLRDVVGRISALAEQFVTIKAHPLEGIARTAWSPTWEDELFREAALLDTLAAQLDSCAQAAASVCGITLAATSIQILEQFDALADVMLRAPMVPMGLASRACDSQAQAIVHKLREHGVRRTQVWASFAGYEPTVSSLLGQDLSRSWLDAKATWWPKRWFAQRKVSSILLSHRTERQRPRRDEIDELLSHLVELNAEDTAFERLSGPAALLLGETYQGLATDWAAVSRHEAWCKTFAQVTARFAGPDIPSIETARVKLLTLAAEHQALLALQEACGTALLRFREAYRDFSAKLQIVETLANCPGKLCGDAQAPAAITRARGFLQRWTGARKQVRYWCQWQTIKSEAIAQGIEGIVAALESGGVTVNQAAQYFEYSYQTWWLKKTVDRQPVLLSFASADHERKIREFRTADERFQKLTCNYIIARLAGRIPNANVQIGPDSEMGRLRRELQRQRGLMPVRQLVQGLPTLLPKLKPCLLMSPLSVAQYLDPSHPPFDLIVFDEASQIPVWDAVGAIARGKQLVVVGDPKQLPPTNFFHRTDDEDELIEEEIKDLESVLDECLAAGLRQQRLEWHYRSRHESLIAFSNVNYYDSRLITFPSPVTQDTAVSFRHVPGVYDRGGSKTNRAEAEAIVQTIEKHYLDPVRRQLSMGVVTFNQPQMQLIQSLLDARRLANANLDRVISEARDEELFVKNLENVQGDERDVILFSITYGPDKAGKISMVFGPLNHEGGQRRLNVAISRAREQVIIFSTLLPEQIDVSRTRAAGVLDLKNYLDFARKGPSALVAQSSPTGLEPDSPFEVAVIAALRQKGWTVHPQVGCTGYRIDIGVVNPHAPGAYLIGVECDGRSYHSGATARDRDRLRQLVLESLGWRLHRIWSTDWWTDKEHEIEKLNARIQSCLEEVANGEGDAPLEAESCALPDPIELQTPAPGTPSITRGEGMNAPIAPTYTPAKAFGGRSDDFENPLYNVEISRQILDLVNSEGPVAEEILFRKIARSWGLERTGSRISGRLRRLAPSELKVTTSGARFYWPAAVEPIAWSGFRAADGTDESRRHIDDVAVEEIANVALFLLDHGGSMTLQELTKGICKTIGMSRITADSQQRAALGVKRLQERGRAAIDGEYVRPASKLVPATPA